LSNLSTPSADQLAAARLAHWRHNGDPILTINMLRDWLNASGMVLYTPRAQQLPTPAPTFVESILGAANATPSLADTEQPRSLLARLIADGGAVPLNLLGSPTGTGTETPDFIVSPLAFPYIFTLRGDKAWKQPPVTSGPSKVSPLALATYNLLAERITMSAYDLTTQLGKEVTEAAVLRALTELWQHLRVIPIPQPDGAPTLWELTTTRFTKQIKAGANAGQPTALSALISLYLSQSLVATEDEIETFLSPVAARSRIRDVVHALISARQLETIAIEGKTVVHVAGELPAFAPIVVTPAPDDIDAIVPTTEGDTPETPRITKFVPKPRKVGTGFVNRPAPTGAPDRERRPFNRDAKPDYSKPWEEEKRDRSIRRPRSFQSEPPADQAEASTGERPARPYTRKPSFDREGKRPSFGSKPSFGSRPSFGSKSRMGGDRPTFRRDSDSSESRPPRRDYAPRSEEGAGESRPPRRTFSKPGTFDRKREGFAGKPFRRDGESRPPRRDFGDSRPPRRDYGSRSEAGSSEARPPRREYSDSRPPRRDFGDSQPPRREFGDKPAFSRDRAGRGDRSEQGPRSGPPYRKFDAPRGKFSSARSEGSDRPTRPARSFQSEGAGDSEARPRRTFGTKKPYTKSSEGFSDRPKSFGAKGKSSYASKGKPDFADSKPYGKKPFAKSGKPAGKFASKSTGSAGKSASTFDKFKDNKKPFGKRPPSRKYKSE